MSVLMSVLGLSAAFFSFVVPALSDRFGRRPVIVIFNFIGLLVPLAALYFPGSLFMLGTLIFIGWSASGNPHTHRRAKHSGREICNAVCAQFGIGIRTLLMLVPAPEVFHGTRRE